MTQKEFQKIVLEKFDKQDARLDKYNGQLTEHIRRTDLLDGAVASMTAGHKILTWSIGGAVIIFIAVIGWLMAEHTVIWQQLLSMD